MQNSSNHFMPRILIIAGSDSSGGAGIQADIKTVTCLGGYAMTAITALTAQNTLGVQGAYAVPPVFIKQQINACVDDIGVDAIKIGMLHNTACIEVVVEALMPLAKTVPIVIDPVMVAKGGAPLLETEAVSLLKETLLPLATVITPNLPEAAVLVGQEIATTVELQHQQANMLAEQYQTSVLVKGGHGGDSICIDLLIHGEKNTRYSARRKDTRHTHGTGCTFASAIATELGKGRALEMAVATAHLYVQYALEHAPQFGKGHGPLGHGFWQLAVL